MNNFERRTFDLEAYNRHVQSSACFICEMVAGKLPGSHIVYQTDQAIVFLNKYPTLYGYTLVAPREHREQVTGDFSSEEYLKLQRLIYCVSEAVRAETQAERVYILSLGSQQGNKHVHWHIAPLPPGVPYEKQQLAALAFRNGVLEIPEQEMASLAARLRERIEKSNQAAIRTIAICVFRHEDRILVFEGCDSAKPGVFYRPLGGGIQPGEYSIQTIAREIREEIGAEITDVRYLGTLENIFTCDGQRGHEIVQVYDGSFVDRSFYDKELIEGVDDGVSSLRVMWKSLEYFRQANASPLYPDGLLELLTKSD